MNNLFYTLVGGRFYFSSEEHKIRFYLNLLVGGNYYQEEIDNVKFEGGVNLELTTGAYFEINKFLIGLAYENPQNVILKMGYIF